MHEQLLEQFIASYKPARARPARLQRYAQHCGQGKPPAEIILDFDTTDDVVHGEQEGRFFHGYYDNYCFLPLYVFCGDQILAVDYMAEAEKRYEESGEKQRLFVDLQYGAHTWDRQRRVILKAEHLDKGSNPHYVVTNLEGEAQYLYKDVYCARGEMENRIKEQQLDLFSDRTSCTKWWPNQFRLLLSSLAYVLIESIRRLALQGSDLAQATCGTIRLKLLKVGAVIIRNTRRIRFHLSSA